MPGLDMTALKKRTNFDIFKDKIKKGETFVRALPSGAPATTGTGDRAMPIKNIIIGYSNKKNVKGEFIKTNLLNPSDLVNPEVFRKKATYLSSNVSSAHRSKTIIVPYYIKGTTAVKYMKLDEIWKSKDFGGAGGRSSTKKEDDALAKLDRDIKQLCKNNEGGLTISYEGVKWKGIFGAKTVTGTPKSDFGLVNVNDTIVCHISHKDGRTASKFSQWGGMTLIADGGVSGVVISKHKEVVQFIRDMHARYPVGSPAPTLRPALKRPIKDTKLKLKAAYGPKCTGEGYTKSRSGVDCVDLILQGTNASLTSGPEAGGISLKKTPGSKPDDADYTISSDGHNMKMGSIPSGAYEPVLMMLFKEATRKDFSVQGARFSIFTNKGRGTAIAEEPITSNLSPRNLAGYGGNWLVKYGVSGWQKKQCECDVYPAFCETKMVEVKK